jgi:hypothetical protein
MTAFSCRMVASLLLRRCFFVFDRHPVFGRGFAAVLDRLLA